MLYINLDWDWLTSNSCKCSCKFSIFRDILYVASVVHCGLAKTFLSSRKILSIVIMWYWLQCC